MAILAVVAVVVIGAGNTTGKSSGSGSQRDGKPRPHSTAVYPVHFPGWKKPPKPKPTVSYPIRFSPKDSAR